MITWQVEVVRHQPKIIDRSFLFGWTYTVPESFLNFGFIAHQQALPVVIATEHIFDRFEGICLYSQVTLKRVGKKYEQGKVNDRKGCQIHK